MKLIAGCGVKPVPRGAVAVDINLGYILKSKELSEEVNYICASLEALPFKDSLFSEIICQEVLEHIEDKRKTLMELWRVTKFGSKLYFSVAIRKVEEIYGRLSSNYRRDITWGQHRYALNPEEYIYLISKFKINKVIYDQGAFDLYLFVSFFMDRWGVTFDDAGQALGEKGSQLIRLCWVATRYTRPLFWLLYKLKPKISSKSLLIYATKE